MRHFIGVAVFLMAAVLGGAFLPRSEDEFISVSPEECVSKFWRGSLLGDQELVENLIVDPPDGFRTGRQDFLSEGRSDVLEGFYDWIRRTFFRQPFLSRERDKVERKAVLFFARTMFLRKEPFSSFHVASRFVGEDVAIISIRKNGDSNINRDVYFLLTRVDEAWKICTITSDRTRLDSITEQSQD